MEWYTWLILGGAVWYFGNQYMKSRPEAQIEKYELFTYTKYEEALTIAKKGVEDARKSLKEDSKFFHKDELKDLFKHSEDELKHLQAMNDKFKRVIERTKHDPAKERLKHYDDWCNYLIAYKSIDTQGKILDVSFEDDAYDTYHKEVKDRRITMEEIERRFDLLLK